MFNVFFETTFYSCFKKITICKVMLFFVFLISHQFSKFSNQLSWNTFCRTYHPIFLSTLYNGHFHLDKIEWVNNIGKNISILRVVDLFLAIN